MKFESHKIELGERGYIVLAIHKTPLLFKIQLLKSSPPCILPPLKIMQQYVPSYLLVSLIDPVVSTNIVKNFVPNSASLGGRGDN